MLEAAFELESVVAFFLSFLPIRTYQTVFRIFFLFCLCIAGERRGLLRRSIFLELYESVTVFFTQKCYYLLSGEYCVDGKKKARWPWPWCQYERGLTSIMRIQYNDFLLLSVKFGKK